MRVKSNFHDYYDYVEYLYSPEGGDKENTYDRRILVSSVPVEGDIPMYPQPKPGCFPPTKEQLKTYYRMDDWTCFPWRFKWCFVAGRLYLLVAKKNYGVDHWGQGLCYTHQEFRLLTEEHPCVSYLQSDRPWRTKPKLDLMRYQKGISSPTCDEVAKKLGPVFIVDEARSEGYLHGRGKTRYQIIPGTNVPNLGQLGFASIIPAEQMYQNISMYLGNLQENPDSQPPAVVSDTDRLVQRGFDKKVSFRGK